MGNTVAQGFYNLCQLFNWGSVDNGENKDNLRKQEVDHQKSLITTNLESNFEPLDYLREPRGDFDTDKPDQTTKKQVGETIRQKSKRLSHPEIYHPDDVSGGVLIPASVSPLLIFGPPTPPITINKPISKFELEPEFCPKIHKVPTSMYLDLDGDVYIDKPEVAKFLYIDYELRSCTNNLLLLNRAINHMRYFKTLPCPNMLEQI